MFHCFRLVHPPGSETTNFFTLHLVPHLPGWFPLDPESSGSKLLDNRALISSPDTATKPVPADLLPWL